VTLVIVASLALSAGRASAECGDYVTVLTGQAARSDTGTPGQTETPAPTRPPCHGPNCSGRDFPPLAPVVPIGPSVKELTQDLAPVGSPDPDPGSTFDRDSATGRPIQRAFSVFHPPRAG
jgi:hypothetical protein